MDKIFFDKDYSDALICAMYESNKIKYEPKNEQDSIMFKNTLKNYKRKEIKKKALTYALLYDGIELLEPCIDIQNELIVTIHDTYMDDFDLESLQYAMDIRDISLTNISNYRDLLSQEDDWFAQYKVIKNKNRKLIRNLSCCFYNAASLFLAGDIEKAFMQIPVELKQGLKNAEVIKRFEMELIEGELSPLSATIFVYMRWIEEIVYAMKLSTSKKFLL